MFRKIELSRGALKGLAVGAGLFMSAGELVLIKGLHYGDDVSEWVVPTMLATLMVGGLVTELNLKK